MSHNLINNIIPGAIALAIIVGGIFWLIIDDMRRQDGREPLRLRFRASHPGPVSPVQVVSVRRASTEL
jgi:hypothetical protein